MRTLLIERKILLAAACGCAVVATGPLARSQQPGVSAGIEQATSNPPAVQAEHPWMPVLRWARQEEETIDRNVRDYSATIVSRERIDGKLEEYRSIFVKVRHRPPSVYVYVLAPEGRKGDEAIYVEGRNNGKLLGHTTAISCNSSRTAA